MSTSRDTTTSYIPSFIQFLFSFSVKNTPVLGPLSSRQMKIESHMKNEARKDMKFAIDEKRKQELHMNKLRS